MPKHSFLNLSELQHPQSGEMLAECLSQSLNNWGITQKQVLLIITDNGANMVKAIRLMQERSSMSDMKNEDETSNNEIADSETEEAADYIEEHEDTSEPEADIDQLECRVQTAVHAL